MKKISLVILALSIICIAFAQTGQPRQEELISIGRDISFPQAINMLEVLSHRFEGKRIINTSSYTGPVGMPLKQVYWRDALELMTKFNELELEERPSVFYIKDPEIAVEEPEEVLDITLDSKQIKISSIFFVADRSFLQSVGIDWSTLLHGEVVASVGFAGGSRVADDLFQASGSTRLESGDIRVDLNTLFRIVESHQLGTVIARPSVTVLSGKPGFVQVGSDFSTRMVDEAGNVVETFFTTGIIMNVTPTIIERDGIEAVHLVTSVEKSSAIPGEVSTVVNRSQSDTEVLLFDGEETVIGGIYDTDRTVVRTGIPILKDLPWWVFGIRYLTGFNREEVSNREMIVILKAEIIEPVSERLAKRRLTARQQVSAFRSEYEDLESIFIYDEDEIPPLPEEEKPKFELPVIYFDFDEDFIKESENNKLDRFVNFLKRNRAYHVVMSGYSDERGDPGYNQRLSLRRAHSTRNYLIEQGIDPERLKIFGHGERMTLDQTGEKVDYEHNRIVEFRIYIPEDSD